MRPGRWASEDDHVEADQTHPEQVIRKLREADRMLAEQKSFAEVAKQLGVSRTRITAGATNTAGRRRTTPSA